MLSTKIQEQVTEEAPHAQQERNQGLLRSREGDPVHDAGIARHPRHDQRNRQGKGRKPRKAALEKDDSAKELEKGRQEILRNRHDQSQRRPAAGRDRRTARRQEPLEAAIFARPDRARSTARSTTKARATSSSRSMKIDPGKSPAARRSRSRRSKPSSTRTGRTGRSSPTSSQLPEPSGSRAPSAPRTSRSKAAPTSRAPATRPKPTRPATKRTRKKLPEACPAPVTQVKPALPGTGQLAQTEGRTARPAAAARGLEEGARPKATSRGGTPGGAAPRRRPANSGVRRASAAPSWLNRLPRPVSAHLLHPRPPDPRLARQPDRRGRGRARVRRPRPRRGALGRLDRRVRGGRAARRRRRLGRQGRLAARSPTSTARSPRR